MKHAGYATLSHLKGGYSSHLNTHEETRRENSRRPQSVKIKVTPFAVTNSDISNHSTTPNISTNPSSESDGSNDFLNEDDHSSPHNPPTDSTVKNITTTHIATNNNENSNNPMYDRNTLLRKAAQ